MTSNNSQNLCSQQCLEILRIRCLVEDLAFPMDTSDQ